MITRRGLAVLGIGLALLPVAVALNHLTLALLGVLALAFMVSAWRSVSRAQLSAERTVGSTWVPEGARFQVSFQVTGQGVHQRVRARQPLPQGVVLHGQERVDGVLGPGESADAAFDIELPIRGLYTLPAIEVRTSDPFGLIERVIEVPSESHSITVIPQRIRSRRPLGRPRHTKPRPGQFISSRAGSGQEFYSIREYLPNDALRLVNWKASARADELMVNQFHDERVTQTVALIDHRLATGMGPFQEAPIHEIARAGALTFQSAFEGGDSFVAFLVGDTPEVMGGDGSRAFTNRFMGRLAELEPEGDCPLEHAVRENLHNLKQGARVIFLSPMAYEDDLQGLMTLLARECTVTVVVPKMPEPTGDAQQAWYDQHKENVQAARGLGVHVVEVPLGVREHALGPGVQI